MARADPVIISSAVEGLVDEAVVRRLIVEVGGLPGPVYGRNGKGYLRKNLPAYSNAARRSPWVVLVDLDQDAECAPPFRASWLPAPVTHMCFRVVVREVEAWLLADRERLASFLGVPISRVPRDPESVDDPKGQMVALARRSLRRDIREDMVPRPQSRREVGPAYSSRLIEFADDVVDGWRPLVAAKSSDSLHRCIRCLSRLVSMPSNLAEREQETDG